MGIATLDGPFSFFLGVANFSTNNKKLKYLCEVKFQVNILKFTYTSKNFESSPDDNIQPKISKLFLFEVTFRRSQINRHLQRIKCSQ